MRGLLAAVIVIVGVLAIIAGVLYLTQEAHSLPSFFPGYVANSTGKHPSRGIAGVALGGVLVIVGMLIALSGRRRDGW